jgi:hypothetical protein
MRVPPGIGYRAVASQEGFTREASAVITLEGAQSLDVDFELMRDPGAVAMRIEGIAVEIEARHRRVARQLLRQYGQNETTMGRRWIGVAALDSMNAAVGSDPGVAITHRGMSGVMVDEAAKHGKDPSLCVRLRLGGCALIVLNGSVIDVHDALGIDFHELEGIAVLSPQDGATFYGTVGGNGVVLLWMRGSAR